MEGVCLSPLICVYILVLYSWPRLSMSSHRVHGSKIYFHCGMRNQWLSSIPFILLPMEKKNSSRQLTLIPLFLLFQIGHRNDILICICGSKRKKERKKNCFRRSLHYFSPLSPLPYNVNGWFLLPHASDMMMKKIVSVSQNQVSSPAILLTTLVSLHKGKRLTST